MQKGQSDPGTRPSVVLPRGDAGDLRIQAGDEREPGGLLEVAVSSKLNIGVDIRSTCHL